MGIEENLEIPSKYEFLEETREGIELCDSLIDNVLDLRLLLEADEVDKEYIDKEILSDRLIIIRELLENYYMEYEDIFKDY